MMPIVINNELKQIPEEIVSLAQLLVFLGIPDGGTATAVNGKIIQARNRDAYKLQPNDEVTIITATYGG